MTPVRAGGEGEGTSDQGGITTGRDDEEFGAFGAKVFAMSVRAADWSDKDGNRRQTAREQGLWPSREELPR
jgi:hypothetical protein